MVPVREKRSLVVPDHVSYDSLREGLEVEAFDAKDAKIYWPARVVRVSRDNDVAPEDWEVVVKFSGYGEQAVRAGELKPHGWSEQQKLQPQLAKRERRSQQLASHTEHTDSDDDGEAETPPTQSTNAEPPRRRRPDTGVVTLARVIDHRTRPSGEQEFLCKTTDGEQVWLPRSAFDETDIKGEVTTTGALLAYLWAPAYIVQTYDNGIECLVAWVGRTENDWARVPASAFSQRDLDLMRANWPRASAIDKQRATYRLFMGIQTCLRSVQSRSVTLDHFPADHIEAVLEGMGARVDGAKLPQGAGDRELLSFSHEELDPLFRQYREKWDELRSSRGKLYGAIDFSEGRGVQIIWFARPHSTDFYTAGAGRPFYSPIKAPNPYVEYVRIRIFGRESTEEEDRAAVQS